MMQQKWLRIGLLLGLMLLGVVAAKPSQAASVPDFTCTAVSEIPPVECEALVALYHNTAGSQWIEQSQWLASDTPCNWSGVICSEGHVQELYLPANNLRGQIPEQLGNLTGLAFLNLSDNHLQGQLPSTLGNLTQLEELYLTGNLELGGELPPTMTNLPHLDLLWYSATQMCSPSDFVRVNAGLLAAEEDIVAAAQLSALDAWLLNREDLQSAAVKCNSATLPALMFFPVMRR